MTHIGAVELLLSKRDEVRFFEKAILVLVRTKSDIPENMMLYSLYKVHGGPVGSVYLLYIS